MNAIYLDHITRNDVRNNRHLLFIFGDNDARAGFGGQAKEMRGEINSHGIRVKKLPEMGMNAFYTDIEYNENIRKIKTDVDGIMWLVKNEACQGLVIPSAGIGTGFAQLANRAPKTAKFLDDLFKSYDLLNGR